MKFVPSQKPTRQEVLITVDNFAGGSNHLVDEARMETKFALESKNLMQTGDGLWTTRWGTQYYGATHAASIDGAHEFVKSDGTTELVTIANGKAWVSEDGGSLTEISGATFTAGLQCYFMQIGGNLYIANGTDNLARYNGTNLTTYTEINAPANLTASLVASGLSSGTYTYYAQVTALNDIGETVGSTEASITTNKDRDNWVAATDKGISWRWDAVANANRYQLYISDESGDEVLLGSTTETNFTDDGSLELNSYVEVPDANTTGAPKFKSMCVSGNRIWATNNTSAMYRVYWSGTGQYLGNFSDFYGGGWIDLEKGGRETPVKVVHYQSGQGAGRATVLCKTPDGQGSVWQIEITSATVGDTTFSVPSATKVIGSFGTESILGAVATANDVAFPNRRGWFSLGPERQYYGILRTNEKSHLIRPYWRNLSQAQINKVASYYYDAKIFISVPLDATGNTRTIIYDTERSNWAVDWSIAAQQYLEYTDSTGTSHFLYVPVGGTRLIELSENVLGDLGSGFYQSYISPLIRVSKKITDLLQFSESTVELGEPRGSVTFKVLGVTKDGSFSTIGTKTIQNLGANTGISSDMPSKFMPSSTQSSVRGGAGSWAVYLLDAPEVFSQATEKRTIKKRAQLYAVQFHIYASTVDTKFTILRIQAKGRLINRKPPSQWTS